MRRSVSEGGFTLVEVMAAAGILSVVVLSLLRGWSVFDRLVFDVLEQQKAVFVLNGEMERLAGLYTGTGFAKLPMTANNDPVTYPALTGLTNSSTRNVYGSSASAVAFTTTSAATFAGSDTLVWLTMISNGAYQNFVWLDRSNGRNLLARISWVSCPVTSNSSAACWGVTGPVGSVEPCAQMGGGSGSAPCQLVTLVLDYPYRFDGTTASAIGALRTMTLSTILGWQTSR